MPRKSTDHEKFSIAELVETFSYDPETGVITWKSRRNKGSIKAGSVAGCLKKNGYVRIQYKKQMLLAHRVAWVIHFKKWPTDILDHVNKDPSDNRICNLREATHQQNMMNRPASKCNPTGSKGVSLYNNGKYRARIVANGVRHHLGKFTSLEEASQAYKRAAILLHGDFASF